MPPSLKDTNEELAASLGPNIVEWKLVAKHAAAILVATLLWGVLAVQIWPEISIAFEGAHESQAEALEAIHAMSAGEREQLRRAANGGMYLNIGSLVVVLFGLTAAAALKRSNRLKHVLAIVFLIWIVNGIQVPLGFASLETYAFSVVKYVIFALVAVGLSFVFVRSTKQQSARNVN